MKCDDGGSILKAFILHVVKDLLSFILRRKKIRVNKLPFASMNDQVV